MNQVSIYFHTHFHALRHSEKARRNFENQRQELKRQRQQQAERNPYNDGYEFDPCADPRFVAHQRNKQAQELAKKSDQTNKTIEGSNNINPFIRIENVTV